MNDLNIAFDNALVSGADSSLQYVNNSALSQSSLISDGSGQQAPFGSSILRFEAEDLALTNFRVENKSLSSGGQHIALNRRNLGEPGIAAGVFDGVTGTYEVRVGFYDENDGVSTADVTVAGQTESFLLDQNLSANRATAKTFTTRKTHSEVQLMSGDTFEIKALGNRGELARFDYIEFALINANLDVPVGGPASDALLSAEQAPLVASIRAEAFIPPSRGETYYVSPNGSDSNPGTKEQPWETIGYATSEDSVVGAGDTILVQPGTYTEIVDLEKSGNVSAGHIVLKANGDVTLIDPDPNNTGGAAWSEGVIQSAGEAYWVIDGFRIENSSFAGISLRDADHMVVQNNHTSKTGGSGIIVLPNSYFGGDDEEVTNSNITILNNTIELANNKWTGKGDSRDVQEALSIWGVDGFTVTGNFVNGGTREGIDIKTGSRNGAVNRNLVTGVASISGTPRGYNGGPAIYVDGNRADTFNVSIYDNIVYGNTADGIVIDDEVPEQGNVKDIRIFNNLVYGNGILGTNGGGGIVVNSNVIGVEIVNNTIADNVQSLVLGGNGYGSKTKASNVLVRNNIFANDSYRGGFLGDTANLVLDNNLFANAFSRPYQQGSGLDNLVTTNNFQTVSAGFKDAEVKDYHLASGSVAVDAGVEIPDYITFDREGNTRKLGDAIDLGAFEYNPSTTSTSSGNQ